MLFDRKLIIIIQMRVNYFDWSYHVKYPCSSEGLWSRCVCIHVYVCLAAFACTHLCMSDCLFNFYGYCLVKADRRSGTSWPPRPQVHPVRPPTRRETSRCCAPPLLHGLPQKTRVQPDYRMSYRLWTRPFPLCLRHTCTGRDPLKKITIRP